MGAISSKSAIPVLERFVKDANRDVRETCEIALAKIEWDNSEEGRRHHAEKERITQLSGEWFYINILIPFLLDTLDFSCQILYLY